MEQNLAEYIDRIDATDDSDELIIYIYEIVRSKLRDPRAQNEICDELFHLYCKLCSLEERVTPVEEWLDLYSDIRDLGTAIQNHVIGADLDNHRRTANLDLIDGILFFMKLSIVRPRRQFPSPQRFIEAREEEDYSC